MNGRRVGTGRGKLILFGEHAAVHGYPAVGLPLPAPCAASVSWTPGPSDAYPPGPPDDERAFRALVERVRADEPGGAPGTGRWEIRAGVPRTGGFGSSAALCVALARLALRQDGPDRYDARVHGLANRLEGLFHGTPSGIDTGMACDDGPAAWIPRPGGIPERRPLALPPWPLVYGALPRRASTADSVAALAGRRAAGDPGTVRGLEALGALAADFAELAAAAASGSAAGFAAGAAGLANAAQEALASLGLSTREADVLFRTARETGADGGKLSGAGCGGAFFLCYRDRSAREEALERLVPLLGERGVALALPLARWDP